MSLSSSINNAPALRKRILAKAIFQMFSQSDICLKTTLINDGIAPGIFIPETLKLFESLAGLSSNIFGFPSSGQ